MPRSIPGGDSRIEIGEIRVALEQSELARLRLQPLSPLLAAAENSRLPAEVRRAKRDRQIGDDIAALSPQS